MHGILSGIGLHYNMCLNTYYCMWVCLSIDSIQPSQPINRSMNLPCR
jgi:hypothetical protein